MTFIASVKAKKGVAIIADSLVTTQKPVISAEDFIAHITKKKSESPSQDIQLEIDELLDLFKSRTSHTKDYEEKLFMYDNYTAITTAGSAQIGSKRVGEIIQEIVEKNKRTKRSYAAKKIETKVKDFCDYLSMEVKNALTTVNKVGFTSFILTHYDKKINQTLIYKINILESQKKDLLDPNKQYVDNKPAVDVETVVCDGQNGIAQDILYGKFFILDFVIEETLKKVGKDMKMSFIKQYEEDTKKEVITLTGVDSEFKLLKLKNLSLQQAVDLANLLMKIEMDFQKYTEDIPTVGGVIKIAVIDAEGFRFIAGHEIVNPLTLH